MSSPLPALRFVPNPELAAEARMFATVRVDLAKVLKSWRKSLFSYEWLNPDGSIKAMSDLAPVFQDQRNAVEKMVQAGEALPQPVLGVGLLECIEIGAGREVLLTLAAMGYTQIPVHVPQPMMKEFEMYKVSGPQAGNVLIYILIAVVLLAALSFVVSRATRSSSTDYVSTSRLDVLVAEQLRLSDDIQKTVARLRLRGCTDTQISFENDVTAWNVNPSAPVSEKCHVFKAAGGGLVYRQPPAAILDATKSANPIYGHNWFTSSCIAGVGTTGATCWSTGADEDLVMVVPFVRSDFCAAINKKLGVNLPAGTPTSQSDNIFDDTVGNEFEGSYADYGSVRSATIDSAYAKWAACIQGTGTAPAGYHFYQVLLAR